MNVLEKITKEIEERVHMVENIPTHGEDDFLDGEECYEDGRVQGRYEELVWCRGMIHSNMDDAADMNNGWIPVEEQLPEEEKEVLAQFVVRVVHTNNTVDEEVYIHPLYYKNGTWQSFNGVPNGKVEAWQNLPEPYKPDEN